MTAQRDYVLKRAKEYGLEDNLARFSVETGGPLAIVELGIPTPGIVRYRILPQGAGEPVDFDLLAPDWRPQEEKLMVREEGQRVVLEAHGTTVEVEREPWTVSLQDGSGGEVLREMPQDVNVRGEPLSKPTGFSTDSSGPSACRVTFYTSPFEHLYGLGEKATRLDKRGQRLVCWNRNPYGAGSELAYKNIPFLVSTKGYGLFLNDTHRSTWDLGSRANFSKTIEVEGPALELFILLGGSPKEVLAKYAQVTGHAPLPPRWSFGVWFSPGWGQHLLAWGMNQKSVLELAEELRRRHFPCDVLHLDPYWMGDKGYCSLQWGKERFPDPAGMIKELKEMGFRLCLWEHPYIDKETEMYREGTEKGYLLKRGDGSVYDAHLVIRSGRAQQEYTETFYDLGGIVDFSSPRAVEWYKGKHRALLDVGVDVFKTDFGEEIPEDAHFANGKTGKEMHNAYPLLYNRAVFEVTSERTDRPMVWARSAFAGSQRMPVHWSGDPAADFPSLAATIRAGMNYGMSGVPFWTFDLGGFKGEPTKEAYVRWVQTGLLISHSRFHGTSPRIPWHYGEEVFRIVQRYVRLRYRLLPYIYGAALESTRTGLPMMRPLFLEFEDDPGSYAMEHQFLLGPSLLVVPVLDPGGKVEAYIPPSVWYDLWTGERVTGPRLLKMELGLDTMPLYVRENAIMPTAEPSDTVPLFWDPLTLEVYPDALGRFEVPEEEGHPETVVEVSRGGGLKLQARGPRRAWRLALRDMERPSSVALDTRGTWDYNDETRTLEVRVEPCEVLNLRVDA